MKWSEGFFNEGKLVYCNTVILYYCNTIIQTLFRKKEGLSWQCVEVVSKGHANKFFQCQSKRFYYMCVYVYV